MSSGPYLEQADKVLAEWATLEQETGRVFLTGKLAELAQHRGDLERGLAEVDVALRHVEREQVTAEAVRSALGEFSEIYACLMPFERKELIRLVLRRAEVGDRQIVLEMYPVHAPLTAMAQSQSRSEPTNWLPELVRRSVLRDAFSVHLPSLVRWAQAKVRDRRGKDVRSEWAQAINAGLVRTRAELARREGVSRARVTQILGSVH